MRTSTAVAGGMWRASATALFAAAIAIAPTHPAFAQAAKAAPAVSTAAAAELEALIKAAKAEGELTFYSGTAEGISKRTAEAFTAKYGVKAAYLRLASGPLLQRYAAEADANNVAADAFINSSNPVGYADDGIKKGWVESIAQAGLPAVKSGEFPARFVTSSTAVVQISPWLIGYNSDKVKGADIPKDWPDVVNAKWKGQVILPDPRATDAYLDYWLLLLDTYGENFFTQLRALNARQINSGVPAMATVAAGENALTFPAVASVAAELVKKGATLGTVIPELTTGIEFHIALTSRARAKHPNAARLFAHYVMTAEGNAVMARDSGAVSVFDTSALPKRYQFAKPGAAARKDQLYKLLGF